MIGCPGKSESFSQNFSPPQGDRSARKPWEFSLLQTKALGPRAGYSLLWLFERTDVDFFSYSLVGYL